MVNNQNYDLSLLLSNTQRKTFVCLTFDKNTSNEWGYNYIWVTHTHTFPNSAWLKLNINKNCKINLYSTGYQSLKILQIKLQITGFFSKRQFETENYLYSLDDNFLRAFCQFRTLNHKLLIESGRWKTFERTRQVMTGIK